VRALATDDIKMKTIAGTNQKRGSMRRANFTKISVIVVLGAMLISPQARADLVFELGTVFNGTTPSGSGPWLTADFHTVGTGGTVTLTLAPNLQNTAQFISEFTFNINSSFLPSGVTVVSPTGTTVAHTTDNAQNISPGFGGWKGWDFVVSFPTGANQSRFNNGTVVITLTAPGLTAQDFGYLNSSTANGQPSLFVGAHVQGIPGLGGTTTSGAIGSPVPEAPTVVAGAGALLLVLLGIGLNSRRSGVIRIGN
jgi:hypothetical protein